MPDINDLNALDGDDVLAGDLVVVQDVSADEAKNITVAEMQRRDLTSNGVNVETLTGAKTLVTTDARFQKLDPGGAARDVNLPAEADSKGLAFIITNAADAAENLTVKDDGASTIGTLNQNERSTFVCDGTSWYHMGIETIALT